MSDRGDIGLPLAIGAGAVAPALVVANLVDGALGVCLGLAVIAGGMIATRTIWREFVRPVLEGARAQSQLPERFDKLEHHQRAHLGITRKVAEHIGIDISEEVASLEDDAAQAV